MQTILGILVLIVGAIFAFKLLIVLFHGIWFLLGLASIVIWIAALAHIVFSKFDNLTTKVLWFVAVFFTHIFGAIAYFLLGRPRGVVRTYIS